MFIFEYDWTALPDGELGYPGKPMILSWLFSDTLFLLHDA